MTKKSMTDHQNKPANRAGGPKAGTADDAKKVIKALKARITALENEKVALLSIVAETRLELEADLQRQTSITRQREMDIAVLGDMLHARDHPPETAGFSGSAPSDAQIQNIMQCLQTRRAQVAATLKTFKLSKAYRKTVTAFTQQADMISRSPFFNENWYRNTYPDLHDIKNLKAHFVRFGALEGRNPGPDFDTMQYYLAYPEVAEAGMCALVHYLLHGREEGRMIYPVAEPAAY